MKRLIFIIASILLGQTVCAQDIIQKKDATEIQAKVLKITDTEIEYQRWDNPDGPIYTIPAEDVFTITGRGTVATGRVERGVIKVGDTVEIVGLKEEKKQTVATGLEMFRKTLDQAEAGDNIGALLRGIERNDAGCRYGCRRSVYH